MKHLCLRKLLVVVALLFVEGSCAQESGNFSSNVFVERCRRDCAIQRDVVVCGKYRVVRWLNDVTKQKEFSYGPFKVIQIPSIRAGTTLPKLPRLRNFKGGMNETLNFVQDAAENLLAKRALVYTIDQTTGARSFASGPMVLDEDELAQVQKGRTADLRIFKKKKALILPIVILLELLKLKFMMIPVFLGVHFIKKILVIGSLVLPSILTKLKICKVPQYPPPHVWATAGDAPVDYPTGYGHEDPGWPHRSDVQSHYGGGYSGYHNPYGGYFQGR